MPKKKQKVLGYVPIQRSFSGRRYELYQENPVCKSIANSVALGVRSRSGKARVVAHGRRGYYVVYARDIRE